MRRMLSIMALPLLVVVAIAVMASVYIVDVRERALVLRHGKLIEEGPVAALFTDPQQPYTQGLVAAARAFDAAREVAR